MPVATPIAVIEDGPALVKYDDKGLVTAVIQEEGTGLVLMVGWMNADTLRQSFEQGRTVFWSRSRQEVWRKGDTSGDRQFIRSAHYDPHAPTPPLLLAQHPQAPPPPPPRPPFHPPFRPPAPPAP